MLGLYWGYIRIMEKQLKTTIQGLGFRGMLDFLGLFWDNGKENGDPYLGLGIEIWSL